MKQQYKWGIDLGGTKIEAVILDGQQQNKIIERQRVPTLADRGYKQVISQVQLLVDLMKEKSGLEPQALGIGTPGRLDPITQTLKNSNSVCLNGEAILQDLESKLNIPIKIENDANCFAMSEAVHCLNNDYPNAQVIFGIILGTGVGGGIVVNGKLISGIHGIGGEWGHNFLDDSGGDCYCGKAGCVERVLAGPSLQKYYHQQTGIEKSLKEIVSDANDPNNIAAAQTLDRLYEFFGKGISTIINILDPDLIIIGGGVGNIEGIYTEGVQRVGKYLFNNRLQTKFLKPHFGDSSGVLGAALLHD